MNIRPLRYQFDPVYLGEKEQKITEQIYLEDGTEVGLIELFIIQGNEELKGWLNQYRSNDTCMWEPLDVFLSIRYDDDDCFIDGKMAYLKTILIHEEFQNKGLGTQVIQDILSHLKDQCVDFFILQPSPISLENQHVIHMDESEENKNKRIQLTNFYQSRFGFEKVPMQEEIPQPIYYVSVK